MVLGIGFLARRREGAEFGLHVRDLDIGTHASNDLHEVRAPLFGHRRISRRLHSRVLGHRHPDLGRRRCHRKVEARRHDADDREAATVHGQRIADRISDAQVVPAELVADDGHVGAGALLLIEKPAAQMRFHTKG